MESGLFKELLDGMDVKIVERWRAAKTPEAREYCHLAQEALSDVTFELLRQVAEAAAAERADKDESKFFRNLFSTLKQKFRR